MKSLVSSEGFGCFHIQPVSRVELDVAFKFLLCGIKNFKIGIVRGPLKI
jgi:hypothetical protein